MTIDLFILDETRSTAGDDDDLDHLWCCDHDLALCGADISDAEDWTSLDEMPNVCVVCLDLADTICPRCGA